VEPGSFEVVPRVRWQKRHLVGEDGARLEAPPVDRVRALAAKGMVAVSDLDGLARNKADLDTLRKASEKGNVWVDAGSRFATDVMDALVAGAERATVRWSCLVDREEAEEAAEFGEAGALLLGLEFRGALLPHPKMGGEAEALALASALGWGIVVIDEAPAVDVASYQALAGRFQGTGLERWYAGPLRSAGEARALETMGYRGVLVDADRLEGGWG
jgi:uncharacterized protein related to proFAR isomerase